MSEEIENNGSTSTANNLALNSPVQGFLATSDDVDYYKLITTTSGILSVIMDVPTDVSYSNYFTLALYDGSGNNLGQYQTGEDKTVGFGIAAAGTYYLKMSDASLSYITYHDSGQYSLTSTLTAGSANGFESESNNTQATADSVSLGTAIDGQLATEDDVDFYKINTTATGILNVFFDSPSDSSYSDYFTISLYDAAGILIFSRSTGSDISFQTAAHSLGTYFVEVTSNEWRHDSGTYELILTSISGGNADYEEEPNDEYANALIPGSAKKGQIADINDVDWFYIDTDSAGSLNINFDVPTNSDSIEYFKALAYDESGNLLAGRATGKDINFDINIGSAGSYLIGITPGDYFHDSNEYNLTVSATPQSQERESEANDSLSQANTLETDNLIYGQLSSEQDHDFYSVTLNSAGKLTVNFDSPTDSTWSNYFRVEVTDANGALIEARDTGYDIAFDAQLDAPGIYYIAVTAGSHSYNDGDYGIVANIILEDPIPDNAIIGTTGSDSIEGTSQDDLIYGLGGNDQINGSDGNDTVAYRTSTGNLSINTTRGLTSIRGDYAAGEHANSLSRIWNVEELRTQTGIESLSTIPISPILGTEFADQIFGTEEDDLIDGLGGNDFIDGGQGIDVLVLFAAEDQFEVLTIAGITRIKGSPETQEYAGHIIKTVNVEEVAFNNGRSKPVLTNDTNKIIGSSSADSLLGTVNNDIFDGGGGSDYIDGGSGNDTIVVFGKASDYTITYPDTASDQLVIEGKLGTSHFGQSITAVNIETIQFIANSIAVDNPPDLVLTPSKTLLAEGGDAVTLNVSLSVAPKSTVSATVDTGGELRTDLNKLLFNPTNWNIPQSIAVTAVDDTEFENQHAGSLSISIESTDSLYSGTPTRTLNYLITDNDASSFASASGTLWRDSDKDGQIDGNEQLLSGWRVFVDSNNNRELDDGEITTVSDISGTYNLQGLSPGTHTIAAEVPAGWSLSHPYSDEARATIISNVSVSGEDTTADLTFNTSISGSEQAAYDNLGAATNIAAFHQDERFTHIDGQGYSVVVIDTGIDLDHPAFGPDLDRNGIADRIVYQYDFSGSDDFYAEDYEGHGTHVAGIIASSTTSYLGVAPKVNIISLKVFPDSGGGADRHDIKQAVIWVTQNVDNYNILAVNLSLGSSEFHTRAQQGYLSTEFQSLKNQGVIVVSASGNDYHDDQSTFWTDPGKQGVAYPSADPNSLSVGAVWPFSGSAKTTLPAKTLQTASTDSIAFFSQRDDVLSDIFAPGVLIKSSGINGTYFSNTGTSMASPEIAGMVVLAQQLAEEVLGRRLGFEEIRELFKSTGTPIVDGDDENDYVPNTGLTFYRSDILALAEAILELKPPSTYTVTVSAGSTISGNDFGFTPTESVQGLSADDLVIGTSYGETISGGDGNDQIRSGDGDDSIYGEAGDDLLTAEEGNDYVDGGAGNDLIIDGKASGNDIYDGGSGTDTVVYIDANSAITINLSNGSARPTDSVNSFGVGNDIISNIENLIATNFNDSIVGNDANNQIEAGHGNDTIYASLGSDILIGSDGIDTLIFTGLQSGYSINRNSESTLVTHLESGEIDTLISIERVRFSDTSVAYDLDGDAGVAARILGVVKGKDEWKDANFLGELLFNLEQDNFDAEDAMQLAMNNFLGLTPSNPEVVTFFYINLVGQAPSEDELNYFTGLIDNGTYTPVSLGLAASNHDLNTTNLGLTGVAESGIEYLQFG